MDKMVPGKAMPMNKVMTEMASTLAEECQDWIYAVSLKKVANLVGQFARMPRKETASQGTHIMEALKKINLCASNHFQLRKVICSTLLSNKTKRFTENELEMK